MSIFDDIRKDAEEGTPGPWGLVDADTYAGGETDTYMTVGPGDYDPVALVVNEHPQEDCHKSDVEVAMNARRIARVPQLEAIALAAEGLVNAADNYARNYAMYEADSAEFCVDVEQHLAARRLFASIFAFRRATK